MKFLINVIDSENGSATGEEMDAINSFNESLRANGHWILAAGIAGPKHSVVIDNRRGAHIVKHEPLVTTDEHVSGFWIIEAANIEQAQELALGASLACNRKVEMRPFLGN